MVQWRWAAASRRGSSHQRTCTPKQDAYFCFTSGETLVLIASDGAGSASFGGEGANSLCRSIAASARNEIRPNRLPTDEQVWDWIDRARDQLGDLARRAKAERKEFSATLVSLISSGAETLVAHVGDGAAVVRSQGGVWRSASWPEQGEYASTTYFVTDDPAPRLRITRIDEAITAAAIFTDGIERLALDFARKEPHQPFFEGMIGPVSSSNIEGRNRRLSAALSKFLDSDRVLDRTDDDKTLVLASLADS